ncbi:MAG: hypothetical protein RID25_23400 [Cyclobacteriaceae bacterium]
MDSALKTTRTSPPNRIGFYETLTNEFILSVGSSHFPGYIINNENLRKIRSHLEKSYQNHFTPEINIIIALHTYFSIYAYD